ncbi:MAG: GLUG motif-containing protein [Clostridia bacterium]|nr:GLUG motif-containing protein [Clostridia bacterium]MDD4375442.1 GLUG motif-containing protein [Clostridia bacterium]
MKKQGISLIVLVITIVIMIIIAGVVILSLNSSGIIGKAKFASQEKKEAVYKEELTLWIAEQMLKKDALFNKDNINATDEIGQYENLKVQDIIKSMSEKEAKDYKIVKGNLIYAGDVTKKNKKQVHSEIQITKLINEEGYIPISTAEELNNLRYPEEKVYGKGTNWQGTYTGGVDKKYIQVNNIDLSIYSSGKGWEPILYKNIETNETYNFAGIYDGNNYKISNLHINNEERKSEQVGLFGRVGSQEKTVEIKNTILDNVNIINTKDSSFTGVLVGMIYGNNTNITNVSASGKITNNEASTVGGLIGAIYSLQYDSQANINVLECATSITITGNGTTVGGLIGRCAPSDNYTTKIINCYTTADVTGGIQVAGLIAHFDGKNTILKDCYNTGMISGIKGVGGLISSAYEGIIENSYSTSEVIGEEYVGGFVESAYSDKYLKNCFSIGNVKATSHTAGGFAAVVYDGYLENCYTIGDVNGSSGVGGFASTLYNDMTKNCYTIGDVNGSSGVGGFASYMYGETIESCYTKGNIKSESGAGGFVNTSYTNNIKNSYSIGNITGKGEYVGGFAGGMWVNTLEKCYSIGNIIGEKHTGGFSGILYAENIKNCYSKGNVIGSNENVGGFAGGTWSSSIENVYSIGDVSGYNTVGGLIGYGYPNLIINSYSTGNVEGNNDIGGFMGGGGSKIINCYATGNVTGKENVGGFLGYPRGGEGIKGTYYIGEVSGTNNVGGFIGSGVRIHSRKIVF